MDRENVDEGGMNSGAGEPDEARRLLDAQLHGEASAADLARLAEFEAAGPEFAAEAHELRRLRALFVAAPAVSAPEGFSTGVLSALAARSTDGGAGDRDETLQPPAAGVQTTAAEEAVFGAAAGHPPAPQARGGLRLLRAVPWIAGVAAAGLLAVLLGPWAADDRFTEKSVATLDEPAATASVPAESYAEPMDRSAPRRVRQEPDREAAERLGSRRKVAADSATDSATDNASGPGALVTSPTAPRPQSEEEVVESRDVVAEAPEMESEITVKDEAAPRPAPAVGRGDARDRRKESADADVADATPGAEKSGSTKPGVPEAVGASSEDDAGAEPGRQSGSEAEAATRLADRLRPAPRKRYVVFEDEAAARC